MRPITRVFSIAILVLIVALATVWTALALWYRFPAPELGRGVAAGFFAFLGVAIVIALFGRLRFHAIVLFAAAFGAVFVWWSAIKPPDNANWSPDVARQVTGSVDGDMLTLTNVRDFEWRSKTDFTERWETRTYDLTRLQTVDLFMSYWGARNCPCHAELRLRGRRLYRLVDRGAAAHRRRVFAGCRSVQERSFGDHRIR